MPCKSGLLFTQSIAPVLCGVEMEYAIKRHCRENLLRTGVWCDLYACGDSMVGHFDSSPVGNLCVLSLGSSLLMDATLETGTRDGVPYVQCTALKILCKSKRLRKSCQT